MNSENSAAGILPYPGDDRSKADQVSSMFDGIADRYDALNRVISLGLDQRWRRKAIAKIAPFAPSRILDVAAGTGDLTLAMNGALGPTQIVGTDVSAAMLEVAQNKALRGGTRHFGIEFLQADVESLPFGDNSFDAVTVAFGVRNFEHLTVGLKEMVRVLRPGGVCMVLEASAPTRRRQAWAHSLALKVLVPAVGIFLSRDSAAYRYLPKTIAAFPQGAEFSRLMLAAGCETVRCCELRPGVCSVYLGFK